VVYTLYAKVYIYVLHKLFYGKPQTPERFGNDEKQHDKRAGLRQEAVLVEKQSVNYRMVGGEEQ